MIGRQRGLASAWFYGGFTDAARRTYETEWISHGNFSISDFFVVKEQPSDRIYKSPISIVRDVPALR